MATTIVLEFEIRSPEKHLDMHQIGNFGEDVWRHLQKTEWGEAPLDEIDRATSRIVIAKIRNDNLRRLKAWLEQELSRQNLTARIQEIA